MLSNGIERKNYLLYQLKDRLCNINPEILLDINEVEPTVNVATDEDNSKKQEENIKETNQTEDSPSVAKLITPVVLLDDKSISDTKDNDENEGEGKDSLAPLPETKSRYTRMFGMKS